MSQKSNRISVEAAILQNLQRRLRISNGHCTVTVYAIARKSSRDSGLVKKSEDPPRWVYKLADRILQEKGGELWGLATCRHRANRETTNSIQSRIYKFEVDNLEEFLQTCAYCGDSRLMKTPHGMVCATCGLGGGS